MQLLSVLEPASCPVSTSAVLSPSFRLSAPSLLFCTSLRTTHRTSPAPPAPPRSPAPPHMLPLLPFPSLSAELHSRCNVLPTGYGPQLVPPRLSPAPARVVNPEQARPPRSLLAIEPPHLSQCLLFFTIRKESAALQSAHSLRACAQLLAASHKCAFEQRPNYPAGSTN